MEIDPSSPGGSRPTFGGLASGLDTGALIEALLEVERVPLRRMEARRGELEKRQELYRDLNTKLSALGDAARAIDNQTGTLSGASFDEELLRFQATSSDDAVLTADAASGASPGDLDVEVVALAQSARHVSTGFAARSDVVGTGSDTLTIDFGGTQIALNGGVSLDSLRDQINAHADNDGSVRAEILFDGTDYRLVISGTETGVENDVTVTTTLTGPGGEPFIASSQAAADSQVNIFGVTVTRSGNEVADAVPGVTLNLKGTTAPGETVTVSVTRDDDAIAEPLQELVDAYNEVREFLLEQSAVDPEKKRSGPLSGEGVLRLVEQRLSRTLGDIYSFSGNPFSTLSEVGIRFESDGKLELDRTKLDEALQQDAGAVRELLAGDGVSDGAALALARSIQGLTRSPNGVIALRIDGIDDRIGDLDDRIVRFEDQLASREETLVRRFSRLEQLVSSLQSQSSFLGRMG